VIARYWSARTSHDKAPHYAHHLETAVFAELTKLDGFSNAMLLQRDLDDEVEVVVITFWESLESIRRFAGEPLDRAVVADRAMALLDDFDRQVRHYEVVLTFAG
jgi:heme-degrading monooxygenase HmoA